MSRKLKWIVINMLLLYVMSIFSIAYGEGFEEGVATGDHVNVRQEPKIESGVMATLQIDQEFTILDYKENWYEIQLEDEKNGWVYSEFVSLKGKEKELIKKGMVNASILNVREQPDQKAKVLDKLISGEEVRILEEKADWYYVIKDEEGKGWVHSDYIELLSSGDASNQSVSRSANRLANLKNIVTLSKRYLGKPYKWGKSGPNSFDCSGFTSFVYKKSGITLPRTSSSQAKVGQKVSKDALMMGDLVFFDTTGKVDGKITHVGMYTGDGKFIHASSGKNARQVVVSALNKGYYNEKYVTARRIY